MCFYSAQDNYTASGAKGAAGAALWFFTWAWVVYVEIHAGILYDKYNEKGERNPKFPLTYWPILTIAWTFFVALSSTSN